MNQHTRKDVRLHLVGYVECWIPNNWCNMQCPVTRPMRRNAERLCVCVCARVCVRVRPGIRMSAYVRACVCDVCDCIFCMCAGFGSTCRTLLGLVLH